jgi:hypothetical protein
MDFGLKNSKFVPEIDEVPINPHRLREIIEELEQYNLACRLYRKYDAVGEEIPAKYRGRNRYWATVSEGHHETYGEYPLVSIYDQDPEALDGRVLICRYRPERPAQKSTTGGELPAVPLQTIAQAEKQIIAARLEAERQERMKKKDPRLATDIKIKIPTLLAPTAARRRLDAKYVQE